MPRVWKEGLGLDPKGKGKGLGLDPKGKGKYKATNHRGGGQGMGSEGKSKGGKRREEDDNTSVEMSNDDDEDEDDEDDDEDSNDSGDDIDDIDDGDDDDDDDCCDFDDIIPSVDDMDDHGDTTPTPSSNVGTTSSGKVMYDPCYWLPSLHHLITQPIDLPVRQLANTGVLSLILATLSTKCVVLRTLALSCLQRIFELVKRQGPDKDAAFRERPQILVLLNFVKNSVEGGETTSTTSSSRGGEKKGGGGEQMVPLRLPSVVSLFLARAALHLLQPGHELFSKINKYLLSRPFCDVKDVPLFDLLIADGDVQTDMAPRLATFRIVRDGLTTRTDHLNLCRKNGYNRLMLLFPVLTKQDTKAGHAVLDLLDKALGMPSAARYLVERCGMVSELSVSINSIQLLTNLN